KKKKKKDADKQMSDPTPVKIRLRSDSDKLLHSYPIRCEGHPTSGNVKGEFKWYRINGNAKAEDDNNNFQPLLTTTIPVFHPSMEDSTNEIACQWIPDAQYLLSYQPSSFARIGPLVKDPAILTDAQTMIDHNSALFHVEIPEPNGDQFPKLLKVDCRYATISIMEDKKKTTDTMEAKKHDDVDEISSHYSPSLSSRASTATNATSRSNKARAPSPAASLKFRLDETPTTPDTSGHGFDNAPIVTVMP
ncbi:hypothetical protein RFI_33594, partial [Reticulomyxa filosa]